jgi:hypothetical protein
MPNSPTTPSPQFIAEHIIRTTEHAFDDIAGGKS